MFYAHIAGTLATDPSTRTAANGKSYVTASVRVPIEGEDAAFVSVAAFDQEAAGPLAALVKGDAVSLAGRAKLSSWTAKDGTQRAGVSLVAQRVLSGKPEPRRRKRPDAERADSSGFPDAAGDLSVIGAPR